VRRRVTWQLRDHRGRKLDSEWANRRRPTPHPPSPAPILTWCIDCQIPELLTLAATIDIWWPEINAYIHTGITNARTEGYNRLVKQRAATQTSSSFPDQNQRRHLRPELVCSSVGVVLNVGRGGLDLNVARRLADGSRAGLLIRCESRRCGGDRHGGSSRRQQWCDVLQFHSHDGTP
jgi:hypothetical protein